MKNEVRITAHLIEQGLAKGNRLDHAIEVIEGPAPGARLVDAAFDPTTLEVCLYYDREVSGLRLCLVSTLIDEVRILRALPAPAAARALREAAKLTRERVAAELGVNPRSIRRWEDGTVTPRGAARVGYARLLSELEHELGQAR